MKSTLFNTVTKDPALVKNGNGSGASAHSNINISASASDINRLRAHVNDLSIPYVEIRFNTQLREIEKRWPLYTLNLFEICQGLQTSSSDEETTAEGSAQNVNESNKEQPCE